MLNCNAVGVAIIEKFGRINFSTRSFTAPSLCTVGSGGAGCSPVILQRRNVTILRDDECLTAVGGYDPSNHICLDGGDLSSACYVRYR